MKKVFFAAVFLTMAMGGTSFAAGNSLAKGSMSLGVTVNDDPMIVGKFNLAPDMAVVAGFGFTNTSGDAKSTVVQVEGGFRKYLKVDDFAPFAQGSVKIKSDTGGPTETTEFGVIVGAGAEYFLAKQFSVEGIAGVGISTTSSKTAGVTTSYTTLGTTRAGAAFNFYF